MSLIVKPGKSYWLIADTKLRQIQIQSFYTNKLWRSRETQESRALTIKEELRCNVMFMLQDFSTNQTRRGRFDSKWLNKIVQWEPDIDIW